MGHITMGGIGLETVGRGEETGPIEVGGDEGNVCLTPTVTGHTRTGEGGRRSLETKTCYRSMVTTGDPVRPVGHRSVPVNHFTG